MKPLLLSSLWTMLCAGSLDAWAALPGSCVAKPGKEMYSHLCVSCTDSRQCNHRFEFCEWERPPSPEAYCGSDASNGFYDANCRKQRTYADCARFASDWGCRWHRH